MHKALILLAHGSTDPRWAEPFEAIVARVAGRAPDVAVRLAYLEKMSPDLERAAEDARAGGAEELVIVPLFLAQGGHVRADIPRLVARVQARHPELRIDVRDAAGEVAAIQDALAEYCLASLGAGDG